MTTVHHALPRGFKLHEYQIESVLGDGGFGITYLARDINLSKMVAVKEYLPSDLAIRQGQSEVMPKSQTSEDDFLWGLKAFLQEAQTLAHFEHPNIVPVHRFFEANGTAYIVMAFQEGESLYELIDRLGTLDQTTIEAIVFPLLDGLEQVHKLGFLHRDIKPENIYIRTDGTPVLLDFGAARQALGNRTRSLTSIVTRGFAPFEQYTSTGKQGPWSDIYAMGAVMYNAVTGRPPADSPDRMDSDPLVPAVEVGADRYGHAFLSAIDAALQMKVDDRPQTVSAWRDMLEQPEPGGAPLPRSESVSASTLDPMAIAVRSGGVKRSSGGRRQRSQRGSDDPRSIMSADQAPTPKSLQPIWKRSRAVAISLLVLLGLAVSGGAYGILSYLSPDLRGILASEGGSGGSEGAPGGGSEIASGMTGSTADGSTGGSSGSTGEDGSGGATGGDSGETGGGIGGDNGFGGDEAGGSTGGDEGSSGKTEEEKAREAKRAEDEEKAKAAARARAEAAAKAKAKAKAEAKRKAEAGKVKIDPKRKAEIEAEARAKVKAEMEAKRKVKERAEKRAAARAEAKAKAEAEARAKREARARLEKGAKTTSEEEAGGSSGSGSGSGNASGSGSGSGSGSNSGSGAEAQARAEAEAKRAAEVASRPSLRDTFAGATVYKITKQYPRRDDAWKFYPGGAVRGSFTQAHNNPNFPPEQGGDSGKWWVNGSQLCIKWQNWERRKTTCYAVRGKGKRWSAQGAGLLSGGFTLLK